MKVSVDAQISDAEDTVVFPDAEEIEYENFRGQVRIFTVDANEIHDKGNRISVKVEPTGRRITLKKERIRERRKAQR